ncbi:hypothetical protein V2G26_005232 [Clonostachys chloroleuca]
MKGIRRTLNASLQSAKSIQDQDQRPSLRATDKIPASHRVLKVFRKLFFDPESGTGTGEVAWNDFVYTMTGPGFFSSEDLSR